MDEIKLLMEYESVTQKVLFGNDVLTALLSGKNMTYLKMVIVGTLVFRNKVRYQNATRYRTQYGKDPPSDNATRRWLKLFQETGSVLHRKKREDRAFRRKMVIEYRKRFLGAHKKQRDELFCS
jgi:hypothetical protein